MPGPVDAVTEALIRQRRLSSREAGVARHVAPGMDPAQEARLLESNIAAINMELARAKDPKIRAVLMAELNNLQPQGLVGPQGAAEMLRPAEGPQVGRIYSDSAAGARIAYPGGKNGQDPGILNPPLHDPRLLQQYENRRRGVYYPQEGGAWQTNQPAEM